MRKNRLDTFIGKEKRRRKKRKKYVKKCVKTGWTLSLERKKG